LEYVLAIVSAIYTYILSIIKFVKQEKIHKMFLHGIKIFFLMANTKKAATKKH